LYKEGWKRYAVDEGLKRTKMEKEIKKIDAQTEKAKTEKTGEMTEKEKRTYRQKRLKYIDDRIKAMYPEGGAKDLPEAEMTALRNELADEYDQEVLGKTKSAGGDKVEYASIKRNKKTGEVVYLDEDGNVVKREKGKTKTYTINSR
jgi:tyrosyl-tRNA synthetase